MNISINVLILKYTSFCFRALWDGKSCVCEGREENGWGCGNETLKHDNWMEKCIEHPAILAYSQKASSECFRSTKRSCGVVLSKQRISRWTMKTFLKTRFLNPHKLFYGSCECSSCLELISFSAIWSKIPWSTRSSAANAKLHSSHTIWGK